MSVGVRPGRSTTATRAVTHEPPCVAGRRRGGRRRPAPSWLAAASESSRPPGPDAISVEGVRVRAERLAARLA